MNMKDLERVRYLDGLRAQWEEWLDSVVEAGAIQHAESLFVDGRCVPLAYRVTLLTGGTVEVYGPRRKTSKWTVRLAVARWVELVCNADDLVTARFPWGPGRWCVVTAQREGGCELRRDLEWRTDHYRSPQSPMFSYEVRDDVLFIRHVHKAIKRRRRRTNDR